MRRITTRWAARTGAAAVAVGLIGAGTALAATAAIHLSGPKTAALGSTLNAKVSGYFNATKAHPERANFAIVYQLNGTVTSSTGKTCYKKGTYVAGGPQDKKLRAKTPTTPGHFSTTIKVKAPKAGKFTLCAVLGNYPYKGVFPKPSAWLHYTVH